VAFQPKKAGCDWHKGILPRLHRTCAGEPRSKKVPKGDRWIHEIKFDGYRVQLVLVFTRRGNDWTKRFKKIADDAFLISARSAIIDGEVVVPAADGTTDFSVLQNELKGSSREIVMVAFDLLYLDGCDLRKLPMLQRKALLQNLIEKTDIQFRQSTNSTTFRRFGRLGAAYRV